MILLCANIRLLSIMSRNMGDYSCDSTSRGSTIVTHLLAYRRHSLSCSFCLRGKFMSLVAMAFETLDVGVKSAAFCSGFLRDEGARR